MTMFRARAPVRADLAGGTLDLWPLSQMVLPAVTVNVALDRFASCEIEPRDDGYVFEAPATDPLACASIPARPERSAPPRHALAAVVAAHFELPPCRIATSSEVRPGSGLGGSSSLIVALIAAAARWAKVSLEDRECVELACNLETRVLRLPGGSQDHWAARCGGLSILEFGAAAVRRTAGDLAELALDADLVIADTQIEHHSGMNNWAVFKAVLEGDARAGAALQAIANAADDMRRAVTEPLPAEERLRAMRSALAAEWSARRQLAPQVTSPELDRIIAAAESVGGSAKACGAGGGGCVVALPSRPGGRSDLVRALESAGAVMIDAAPWEGGVSSEAT